MADHLVGARDELNESEASWASMSCFNNVLLRCRFGPFVLPSLCIFVHVFLNATATEWNLSQQWKCSFFQFSHLPLRGNQRDGGKGFTFAEGTV